MFLLPCPIYITGGILSKIAVDDLEPGMKLAKPVENAGGMVLLGEGTELTMELIDRVKNMGAESVYIQGFTKPAVPMETMLAELDKRFSNVEGDPRMDLLKKIFREHIEALYE